MAIQYRQLQAPVELNTSLPDNGSAAASEALANTLIKFRDTAASAGKTIAADIGAKQGALAGASGNPTEQNGLWKLTAYGQAYNNAAMRSYTIKAQADAEDTAARLQVEAGTDVGKFQAGFTAARDATIKAAPPEAKAVLMDVYTQYMGQSVARIATARGMELRDQARTDTSEGIARLTEQAGNLLAQDDPVSHQQAEEAQVKLGLMIDGAQKDGTLSDVEAAALHTDAHHKITMQTVVARFEKELDNPYGDPIEFLDRLHKYNETDQQLLPDEKVKLEAQLYTTLAHKNSLNSQLDEAARHAQAAKYEAGDRAATEDLLSGSLTQPKLLDMVRKQDLKPEIARTLLNTLNAGDPGVDDSRAVMNVETDLLHYSEEDIRSNSGLKFSTRTRLILKRREQVDGWQSTQDAKEAEARIDRSLNIIPGTIMATLDEATATQRYRARTQFYNVMAGIDPAQRQAMAIPTAESVIREFVTQKASTDANDMRRIRASYVKAHPMDSMSSDGKKAYEAQLARYDANIRDLEAKAARK